MALLQVQLSETYEWGVINQERIRLKKLKSKEKKKQKSCFLPQQVFRLHGDLAMSSVY